LQRLCARTVLTAEQSAQIYKLCHEEIRWDVLIDSAARHAVIPLVGRSLEAAAGDVMPNEVKEAIAQNRRAYTFGNMRLCGELAKLTNAFASESIRVLSFKGPTLASLAYGNLALRPFGDLDILIDPSDVVRAARLLHRMGFPAWTRSDEQNLDGECESTFVRPDGGLCVDLHWALSRDGLPFDLPFERAWEQAQTVNIGGADVRTLAMDDLCLFLCLHGTKHVWERLSWVCDIAELIRKHAQLDLERILRRADAIGYARMFLLALELAHSVLDVPLPQTIESRAAGDRIVQKMARRLRAQLLEIDPVVTPPAPLRDAIQMVRFHLTVLNRTRDRLRYLKYAAKPNPRDRNALELPASLHFLHLFSRPVRLFKRYALRSAA
jgi:hypothetical protein